jgi:ABC-type transport system involved in multi-copper enzyme maturation permease subunit
VACLTLVGVALRAAHSIAGEREQQTWDSLLATPLDSNEILFGKWLGSMLSMRWPCLWLGLCWYLGTISGAWPALILPLLLWAWAVYAAFLVDLGLWFSMSRTGTLQASLWTLGISAGLFLGAPLLLDLFCCGLPTLIPARGPVGFTLPFRLFLLSPPGTLVWLVFQGDPYSAFYGSWGDSLFVLPVLFLWTLVCLTLTESLRIRFRLLTGRRPLRPRVGYPSGEGWGPDFGRHGPP